MTKKKKQPKDITFKFDFNSPYNFNHFDELGRIKIKPEDYAMKKDNKTSKGEQLIRDCIAEAKVFKPKPKYTSAPWNFCDTDLEVSQMGVSGGEGYGKKGYTTIVRMVHPKRGMPIDEILANQRLISAAPDLLEALEELLLAETGNSVAVDKILAAIPKARAAIAKATKSNQ